jgi:hypothetical protein
MFGLGLTVAVTPFCARAVGLQGKKHEYGWDDAALRQEPEAAVISSTGSIALQITRPLAAGGKYGGVTGRFIQPRGEIYLLSTDGNSRKLTQGSAWHWSSQFSPDGRQLAALTCLGDSRIGLTVWDIETGLSTEFWGSNVDPYARFSANGGSESKPTPTGEMPRQFAWLGDSRIAYVSRGGEALQYDAEPLYDTADLDARRRRAAGGQFSARVWTDASPTCGAGRALHTLDVRSGEVSTLLTADIRGVVISPGLDRAAILFARSRALPPLNQPFQTDPRYLTVVDDPFIRAGLSIVELAPSKRELEIPAFVSVGPVTAQSLPYWDESAGLIRVPVWSTYGAASNEGANSCFLVNISTGVTTKIRTKNALQASLLSAGFQGDLDEFAKELGPGASYRVWPCKNGRVVVWCNSQLFFCDSRKVHSIQGNFDGVYAPIFSENRVSILAHGSDAFWGIQANADTVNQREIKIGGDATVIGICPTAFHPVFKQDTDNGTSVVQSDQFGQTRTLIRLNSHYAQVQRPTVTILRRAGGGEFGVLQLPSDYRPGKRHPVVIWAYPNSAPSSTGWIVQRNSLVATLRPFQYLLANGFAVFHAPLDMQTRKPSEPLGAFVAGRVESWLDDLNTHEAVERDAFAFFGHSNAGVVALFLESYSKRFRAIVAHATFPDFGMTSLMAGTDRFLSDCAAATIQADRFYYEDIEQPYHFERPFWDGVNEYVRDSPVFNLGSASTPLLLLAGEFDFGSRAMEAVYSILYARGIPVEMAYYWNEGHLLGTPANLRDSWQRTLAFFRKYMAGT